MKFFISIDNLRNGSEQLILNYRARAMHIRTVRMRVVYYFIFETR